MVVGNGYIYLCPSINSNTVLTSWPCKKRLAGNEPSCLLGPEILSCVKRKGQLVSFGIFQIPRNSLHFVVNWVLDVLLPSLCSSCI